MTFAQADWGVLGNGRDRLGQREGFLGQGGKRHRIQLPRNPPFRGGGNRCSGSECATRPGPGAWVRRLEVLVPFRGTVSEAIPVVGTVGMDLQEGGSVGTSAEKSEAW